MTDTITRAIDRLMNHFGDSKDLAITAMPLPSIQSLLDRRSESRCPENKYLRQAIAELRLAENAASPDVASQIRGAIELIRKGWQR